MPQGGPVGCRGMPSTLVFPEAYFESRKKVSTVTQKTNLDVENSMKINDF